MHEFSIAQNMVELAQAELKKASGKRVLSMQVDIGKMSGVVPHALEFAFPAAAKGTEVENCQLSINEVAIEIVCLSCSESKELQEFYLICPSCQSTQVKIIKGKEIQILSMEVE